MNKQPIVRVNKTIYDWNNRLRAKYHRQIALKELDLMHDAINASDLKTASRHKKIASDAIDEMVDTNKMVEKEE